MKPRDYDESRPQEPAQPGAFMPDGSFNAEAGWSQQGPADALVRSLVRQRRSGMTLAEATALIRSAGQEEAFPSLEQWDSCVSWYAAWAQTAAEEAVKRAGRATDGHWCSGQWATGAEKNCSEPGHRERPSPEEARRLIETIIDAMGA